MPPKNFKATKISPRRLKKLVEQNFDVVKDRSNAEEIVVICPEDGCPDRTGNRSFNLKKGITNCWRCTSANGNAAWFLRRHGVEFEDESLAEIVEAPDPLSELEQLGQAEKTVHTEPVALPDGFTLLSDEPDCIYTRLIGTMAQRKHLYLDDFIEAGVGFTRTGEWEPFAIFPVYELGKLVYYQGRTYAPRFEGGVTKKFPSKLQVPLGAGNWVYGYDRIVQPGVKVVIIVESILNVLSLRWHLRCLGVTGVEPVAVFKHHISKVQRIKLNATQADEFCIMYDGDATASAWEEAKQLGGGRIASVASMPVGVDANDDAGLAYTRFLSRQVYSPGNALLDSLGLS